MKNTAKNVKQYELEDITQEFEKCCRNSLRHLIFGILISLSITINLWW